VAMWLIFLLACGGKQGPIGGHDDIEKPRKKKGNKKVPPNSGRLIPAAGAPLDKSPDVPKEDYRPAPKKLKKSNCLSGGRYRVELDDYAHGQAALIVGDGDGPRTLVVALHGANGDLAKILGQTRWDSLPDRDANVAVLIPEAAPIGDGKQSRWNAGRYWEPIVEARDDVAFLDALVREVKQTACIDKVLATGFSNGGQMVFRWACQGDEVDAALTSAGTLIPPQNSCKNQVPFRGYMGTDDPMYTESPVPGDDQPNTVESMHRFARQNGCNLDADPVVERRGKQTCWEYQGCDQPTVRCEVQGYPHGWPVPWGKKKAPDTDATLEGWTWFKGLK